jgi:hypothetical protein
MDDIKYLEDYEAIFNPIRPNYPIKNLPIKDAQFYKDRIHFSFSNAIRNLTSVAVKCYT